MEQKLIDTYHERYSVKTGKVRRDFVGSKCYDFDCDVILVLTRSYRIFPIGRWRIKLK